MGFFDELDFKAALVDIGVYASNADVKLFFNSYDRDKDGRIRYYEFCKAIEPLDPYYAAVLNRRTSRNDRSSTLYFRDNCFSYGTRVLFRDLLRSFFQAELANESVRLRLQKQLSLVDGFRALDVNGNGRLVPAEL